MPVVNTTGGTPTGTQNLGTITINSAGSNASGVQYYADGRLTLPVATASGSVENRYDDPRYYSGDTSD